MSRRGRGGKNRNQSGSAGQNGAGQNGAGQNGAGQNGAGQNGAGQNGRQPKRQHGAQQSSNDKRAHQQGQPQVDRPANKNAQFQSALIPRKTVSRPSAETASATKPQDRRYAVVFFDTLAQAKSDLPRLREVSSQCDQLNIVVRAEATMDDPDLTAAGKLFCGAAWALIHDRRKEDGWYDSPHE